MRLDCVELTNFMSHKSTLLDLSLAERLQVDGKNGSGKTSSAVDGPLWALFGNARGSTLDQLRGPFGTKTEVGVTFEIRGKAYKVTRERGSASSLSLVNLTDGVNLTEKHVRMTEDRIRDLVGTYGSFVNSAVFRQGDALRFALMKPEERRSLFEELLELEAMAEIETRSNKARTANQRKLEESERRLREIEENKVLIAQHKLGLDRLNTDLDQVQPELDDAELTLASAGKEMLEMSGMQAQYAQWSTDTDQAELRFHRAQLDHSEFVSKAQDNRRKQESFEAAKCPTCGQDVDAEAAYLKRLEYREAAIDWQAQANEKMGEFTELEDAWEESKVLRDNLKVEIDRRFAQTQALQKHANTVLPGLRKKAGELKIEIAKLEGSIQTLNDSIDDEKQVRDDHEDQRKRATAYSLISEAFSKRGIPRELMRGFVNELEKSTNTLLGIVSPMKIRIALDKDGVVKSGITEGTVDVWVEDASGERKVEMLSGGEKMRTMTALRLAIAQVQAKRSDRAIRTLILDESLDGLDVDGKDAMLTMLGSLSQTSFDRMIFVTHDPAVAGLFPDRITMNKMSDGATVIL